MRQRPEVPESELAERCAISSALLDPHYAVPILLQCEPSDFNDLRNRAIFEAIRDVHADLRTPDYLALSELLENRGHDNAAGGYLAETAGFTPSAYRVNEFVATIRDRGARRRILDGLSGIAQQCYDIETGVDAIVDNGTTLLKSQVANTSDRGTQAVDGVTAVLSKAHYYYSNPIEAWQTRGIDTGYRKLNFALDGWKRGNVYYILGLEHSGKTWVALNFAMNVCAAGGTAVFFSLEQDTSADEDPQKTTLWERVLLSRAGIPMVNYLKGNLDNRQYTRLLEVGDEIAGWHLTMYDDRRTLPAMEAAVRTVARERTVDLVVIDYLKLIEQPGSSYANRNQEIGGLTSKLKRMALDLEVPEIVPHQVGSKSIAARQSKRITLSDGYESGHISQDADVVLGYNREELFNPETENPGVAEIDILKDRIGGGTGGVIDFIFNKRTGLLSPAARTYDPLPG